MKPFVALWILCFCIFGCSALNTIGKKDAIQLEIRYPGAKEVFFASSLDGFSLHRAIEKDNGRWTFSAPAQTEFRYFFMVDGKQALPPCPLKEADDFGSHNCIASPQGE